MGRDVFEVWCPVLEVVFCVIQDLASLARMFVRGANVAWNNGAVVEEVEDTATMAGEDDLLLGALDGCSEFGGVCFLEFLTSLYV